MIVCRTLGPVEVLVNDQPAPTELLWRKNLALLIYLARSPKLTRTREHLIGLLWADKPEGASRHSLREAVRVLRHCAGEEAVDAAGDQVRLGRGAVTLDVDRLAELAGREEWPAAAALVAGEFLEGFSVPDSSGFEDWLATERLAWRRQSVEVLARCAEQRLQAGDSLAAARLAIQALNLDPLSEVAAHSAMRALALAGDRAGALARYQALAARLGETSGAEPSSDLRLLAARVRGERTWRVPEYLKKAGVAGAESRRPPLVGRESELKRLLDLWRGVRSDKRLAVCVLASDAGMGKTRLLEEVTGRARLDGGTVSAVAAVPADRVQSWSGVLALARGGLLEAPGLAGAQPAALGSFAAQLPEWGERFARQARGVEPFSLGRALSEVVRALAEEQPVVLTVDDAHWLDGPTLESVTALVRDLKAAPVYLVFATAPHHERPGLDALWSHLGRDVPGDTVRLEPMRRDAVEQLARWAIPSYGEAELDRVTRRVLADSAGLPLLAVELLHAVAIGLDLGTVSSAWPQPFRTLEQTLPSALPDAVVAAIRVGFRGLSEPAQRALAVAAVLGDRVSAGAIARAAALTGDALHAALDELEWQRWLLAEPRGYSFVARIVREVVERDMVTPGQRQRILEGG
jgi:DNA-binding SARP family transcriptional activator